MNKDLLKKKIIWIVVGVVVLVIFIISMIEAITFLTMLKDPEFYNVTKSFLVSGSILLFAICLLTSYCEYLVVRRLIPLFKEKKDE